MLRENLIALRELERLFEQVLPQAPQSDIIPGEFQAYFAQVQRSAKKLGRKKRRRHKRK